MAKCGHVLLILSIFSIRITVYATFSAPINLFGEDLDGVSTNWQICGIDTIGVGPGVQGVGECVEKPNFPRHIHRKDVHIHYSSLLGCNVTDVFSCMGNGECVEIPGWHTARGGDGVVNPAPYGDLPGQNGAVSHSPSMNYFHTGVCDCDSGWKGPTCAILDLLPIRTSYPGIGKRVGSLGLDAKSPSKNFGKAGNTFDRASWGAATPIFDGQSTNRWWTLVGAQRDLTVAPADDNFVNDDDHTVSANSLNKNVGIFWARGSEELGDVAGPYEIWSPPTTENTQGMQFDILTDPSPVSPAVPIFSHRILHTDLKRLSSDNSLVAIYLATSDGGPLGLSNQNSECAGFSMMRSASGSIAGPWTRSCLYPLNGANPNIGQLELWRDASSNSNVDSNVDLANMDGRYRWDCWMFDPTFMVNDVGKALIAYTGAPCIQPTFTLDCLHCGAYAEMQIVLGRESPRQTAGMLASEVRRRRKKRELGGEIVKIVGGEVNDVEFLLSEKTDDDSSSSSSTDISTDIINNNNNINDKSKKIRRYLLEKRDYSNIKTSRRNYNNKTPLMRKTTQEEVVTTRLLSEEPSSDKFVNEGDSKLDEDRSKFDEGDSSKLREKSDKPRDSSKLPRKLAPFAPDFPQQLYRTGHQIFGTNVESDSLDDMFLWKSARGFHMIANSRSKDHGENKSRFVYGFSPDGNSENWHLSEEDAVIYGGLLEFDDCSIEKVAKRERPSLAFDRTTGKPTHLITAVVNHNSKFDWDGRATVFQPINDATAGHLPFSQENPPKQCKTQTCPEGHYIKSILTKFKKYFN